MPERLGQVNLNTEASILGPSQGGSEVIDLNESA